MCVFQTFSWDLSSPQLTPLSGEGDEEGEDGEVGAQPVSCIFPVSSGGLYAACGKRVWVIDGFTGEQVVSDLSSTSNCCYHGYIHFHFILPF